MAWYQLGWPEIVLWGRQHVIPRVCPNCMAPGETAIRVATWCGYDSHMQTFYYCRDCASQVKAEQAYEGKECSGLRLLRPGSILGFILASPLCTAGAVLHGKWRDAGNPTAATVAMVIGVVGLFAGAALGWFLAARWSRSRLLRAKERYPLRDGQALWGTATRAWGQRYLACRREWLKLLADANADTLDAASYERVFGRPGTAVADAGS